MSSPPVGPVTGVPPVNAAGAAVRLEILVATEAALEGMLDGATPEAAAKAGPAADASATAADPPAPAPPPNPVAQAVDAARASAAQRQGSLAPLFADLAQAVNAPALPPALRAAIGQVLALQTSLSGPLTAETVRQAVTQSGLFLEAHLAQAPPGAAAPPDLKAALLTLQTALAAVPVPKPPTPPPVPAVVAAPLPTSGVTPGAPPTVPATATTPSPAAASPSPPSTTAATTDPKAALLSLQIAPAAEPTAEAPPATAAGAVRPEPQAPPAGATPAPPTAPGALAVHVEAEPLTPPPARHAAAGYRSDPPDLPPAPGAPRPDRPPPLAAQPEPAADLPPPPPHRAAALAAQPALPASLPLDAKAPEIVGRLQEAVDQAVARQTLHQVASLPDGQTSAWMFELPIATPQGTAIAQFEIQRDGRGQHGGEEAPDGWRLRFSIDVEPLGPVHIHLGLNGDRAQVVVWAERETSLEWLRTGAADLSRALPAEVVFHPGAPRRPTPAPGQFVDQAL